MDPTTTQLEAAGMSDLEALRTAELALRWIHAFLRAEISRSADYFDKTHVIEMGNQFKAARPAIQAMIEKFPMKPRPRGKIVVNGFLRRHFRNL